MGHERLGFLPKTRRWKNIVSDVSGAASGTVAIGAVAIETLDAVRDRFSRLASDNSTVGVFQALVSVGLACREPDDATLKRLLGTERTVTPLAAARFLHDAAGASEGAPEYAELAARAAADAVVTWYDQAKPHDAPLFEELKHPHEVWRKLGSGSAFSDLARLFFAGCTERYLKYYLERAASAASSDFDARDALDADLSAHLNDVSQHAFETARIAQSFAAGWFNKIAQKGQPTASVVRGFVAYAFEKLREVLAREGRSE